MLWYRYVVEHCRRGVWHETGMGKGVVEAWQRKGGC